MPGVRRTLWCPELAGPMPSGGYASFVDMSSIAAGLLGPLLTLASAVGYSIAGYLVRRLTDAGMPIGALIAARGAASASVAATMLHAQRRSFFPTSRLGRQMVLVRGTCGSIAFSLFFVAVSLAPLGDCSAIQHLAPIPTMIIGRIWLKEKIGLHGACALALGTAGVLLLSGAAAKHTAKADEQSGPWVSIGYLAAFVSCLNCAAIYLSVRRAGNAFHPLQGMLLHATLTAVLGLTMMLAVHLSSMDSLELQELQVDADRRQNRSQSQQLVDDRRDVAETLGTGPVGVLAMLAFSISAQTLMSYGIARCQAGLGSLFSATEIVWAYLWQVTLLNQPVSGLALGGAATILASIAIPAVAAALQKSEVISTALEDVEDDRAALTAAAVPDIGKSELSVESCNPAHVTQSRAV